MTQIKLNFKGSIKRQTAVGTIHRDSRLNRGNLLMLWLFMLMTMKIVFWDITCVVFRAEQYTSA
jgi:hypothetical protein